MKIMTHIKNNLKSIFAAVAMVVQMASVAEDITWTAVTNQLNDIDPRLQLGVYIQNVTSNTISESVVGIVEEYVSPLIDTAIDTSTNYTDYAVIKLAETNSVLSGGPYQHELPYFTNAIPYSVIIDAPQMPGNYATVSNAAMNARSMTDLGVRGVPKGEGSWFMVNGQIVSWNAEAGEWRDGDENIVIDDFDGHYYLFTEDEIEFSLDENFSCSTNFGTNTYIITGYTNMLAQVSQIDYTINNTQLVDTIEATAPAPGNYSAVSNAAMNARGATDLGVRGAPDGEGSWFMVNEERLEFNDGVWGDRQSFRYIDSNGMGGYSFFSGESVSSVVFSLDQAYTATIGEYVIIGYTNTIATTAQLPQNYDIVSNRAMSSIGTNVQGNVLGSFKKMYFSLYPETSPQNIVLEAIDLDAFKIDCNVEGYQYLFGQTSSPNGVVRMSDLYGKQDALTLAQTNAINSGVTSDKVETWDGYASQISNKADMVSVTGVVDYAISEFGRTNLVYQITDGTNTIDAAGNVYSNAAVRSESWELHANNSGYQFEGPDYIGENIWRLDYDAGVVSGSMLANGEQDAFELEFTESEYSLVVTAVRPITGIVQVAYGKLALTNDIPPVVTVVAPSTNATSGTAADALATGTALYTGFTEWVFSGSGYDPTKNYRIGYPPVYLDGIPNYYLYEGELEIDGPATDDADPPVELHFAYSQITATRRLITPTKTSQLVNDGFNGVPFAEISDLNYAFVTPGEWEFSDGLIHNIGGPEFDGAGNFYYYLSDTTPDAISQYFITQEDAISALSLTFNTEPAITATRPSLLGHLSDRSINNVLVSERTEISLPTNTVGHSRDFYLYLVCTTNSPITFSPAMWSLGGIGNPNKTYNSGAYLLHFTEITNNLFIVKDLRGTAGTVLGSRKSTGTLGNLSVTEGQDCLASGWYSHAEGYNTTAINANEHSQGRFNASHQGPNKNFGQASNTLWSVGFGTSDSARKNAIETMQDGKTFVYGIGGYVGTNPTSSGVRDLATIINNKATKPTFVTKVPEKSRWYILNPPSYMTYDIIEYDGYVDITLNSNDVWIANGTISIDYSSLEFTGTIPLNVGGTITITIGRDYIGYHLYLQENTITSITWDKPIEYIGISGTSPIECKLVVIADGDFTIGFDGNKYLNVSQSESISNGSTTLFSFVEIMPDKFIVTKQTIGGSGN